MSSYNYNVGQRFLEVAHTHAEQPALYLETGETVTYSDLSNLALSVAGALKKRNVGAPVALLHDKSTKMFGAMLGALLAGVPYACLDVENPTERLRSIIDTLKADLVIGPKDLLEVVSEHPQEAIDVDRLSSGSPINDEVIGQVSGDSIAYVMFTSGSTGVPKGVAISHSNLLNFANWAGSSLSINSGTRMTNVNPMHFDNSVFDFFGCLMNGGVLIPVTKKTLGDFKGLTRYFETAKPNFWFSVPSTLIYLNTMKVLSVEFMDSFRIIMFGGEGYPRSELKKLKAKVHADCRLVNVYGPTECTCICSLRELREEDLDGEGLPPLGKLIPNFDYKIVGDEEEHLPPGAIGELHLFGPNVGLGYFNDNVRTETAFGKVYASGVERRFYRTGDLVIEDPNSGELSFRGRKDNQIKHMGYRIELEEIEQGLNKMNGIEQVGVIYVRDQVSSGFLCAFIAGEMDQESEGEVRKFSQKVLPAYMVPKKYYFLRHLPKNANGKVDKQQLAKMVNE